MHYTSKPFSDIWALIDDRTGSNSQVLGVANALGLPFKKKNIDFNLSNMFRNINFFDHLNGISEESRSLLHSPWPDLLISSGRRMAPIARWVKEKSGGKTRIVHIMFPGYFKLEKFDLVVVPEHDRLLCLGSKNNILRIIGAPSIVSKETLDPLADEYIPKFNYLSRPYIALLVGGATRRNSFTTAVAADLGRKVSRLAESAGGSILLTTSRRTEKDARDALIKSISVPMEVHDWTSNGDNPYLIYLAIADIIFVTGDSISMCSEACATEKPVYIYSLHCKMNSKHKRFHKQLFNLGYARPMPDNMENWHHQPLNSARKIAEAIYRNF